MTEAIIETKASEIKDFFRGQRGTLHVTFEEGCQAAWLYDLIRPYVAEALVCNPRKIARADRRSDRIDAKRLAELLRTNAITPTYHGEHSTQNLKELARCYIAIAHDGTRVKNRLKAVFRGRGIPCKGTSIYSEETRDDWRQKIDNSARLSRANQLWKELDHLTELAEEAKKELLKEARKHASIKILRSAPGIGPLRSAIILAIAVTPHRFRTVKQFWAYCGLAVRSKITGEYEMKRGQIRRTRRQPLIRGLNRNYSRALSQDNKDFAELLNLAIGFYFEAQQLKIKRHQICTALKNSTGQEVGICFHHFCCKSITAGNQAAHLFDIPFRRYYRNYIYEGNCMNMSALFGKGWDLRKIGRWCLLPMAVIVALFLPHILLSFILSFVLIHAIISLHPCYCLLPGRTLPGCSINIRPRGPPIS